MIAQGGDHRDPSLREHFVYRCFSITGRLLYVGCTQNLDRRRREHSSDSVWFSQMTHVRLVGPLNYDTARAVERRAIRTEYPLYNNDVPERRRLVAARSRATEAEARRLIQSGTTWPQAVHAAVDKFRDTAPGSLDPFFIEHHRRTA